MSVVGVGEYLKLEKDIPVVVAGAYCAESQLEAVFYYAFLRLGIFGAVDGHFCCVRVRFYRWWWRRRRWDRRGLLRP